MSSERASGILLHPTSLPGKYGIGTLGMEARKFVDFLVTAKQKYWQILPLGPTGYGDSPYQCFSSKAGNPLLIDMDHLVELGLLHADDLPVSGAWGTGKVDFGKVIDGKYPLLKKAEQNFINLHDHSLKNEFIQFKQLNTSWLDDYALFMALKEKFDNKPWSEWPQEYKMRNTDAIASAKHEFNAAIEFHKFIQCVFFNEWMSLKKYANENGIEIIGDIPIYVAMDSSDAWTNTHLFQFDVNKNPIAVGGVPPDYFSETGQLWGNPLFNWEAMATDGFAWWIDRIQTSLFMFDKVRIDHFRGFAAYWSVPFGESTAINGKWINAPGQHLFESIRYRLGDVPIIAEDLGVITPDVEALRDGFNLPGMKILQFAFDSAEANDFLPHNYIKNCVVYTGTHDNETVRGWFLNAKPEDKKFALEYINGTVKAIHWDMIRAAWSSVADTAIAPMQDFVAAGESGRMNLPGTTKDNWQWRMKNSDLKDALAKKIAAITTLYSRNVK